MKFELTLNKMNKDDTRYDYTFTSGHKLVINELGFGPKKFYSCEFGAPNGDHGEITKKTAQECFDAFKEMFEKSEIRKNLIKDFEF